MFNNVKVEKETQRSQFEKELEEVVGKLKEALWDL